MTSTLIQRRQSIRLHHYDYRSSGAYFVTICTHERQCTFHDLDLRNVVDEVWRNIVPPSPEATADFVVMPNHVHGIIWLLDAPGFRPEPIANPRPLRGIAPGVDAGSLSAIVRAFKAASTKRINNLHGTPGAPLWQRNYYERVIRNDRELDAVREYIADNPRKWLEDPNHPDNLRYR